MVKVLRVVKDERPFTQAVQVSINSSHMKTTTVEIFKQMDNGELLIVNSIPAPSKIRVITEETAEKLNNSPSQPASVPNSRPSSRPATSAEKYAVTAEQPEAQNTQETEEDKTIRERTNRQFSYEDTELDQTQCYVIYCVNTEPIEGSFSVKLNNLSPHYQLNVLVPRHYNCTWFDPVDLPFETSVNAGWEGFSEYGGPPTDLKNSDWLHYNTHFLITVKETTSCTFTVTRTEGDFPIGLVILTRLPNEDDNYTLKNIEGRTIAHTMLPLEDNAKQSKELFSSLTQCKVELRSLLIPTSSETGTTYCVYVVPQKKRVIGYE